ncbi:MAG TPA: hypothetical protein VGR00_11175, partial [Thermoanaerobaculia bacterium]|nr:hypothetical protein [Thermoanaerobaculia bacterium]
DAVRALHGAKGASGWRLLFDDAYDEFTRHPEALRVKGGEFVLPGGREAAAVWADVVGVPPSDRIRFLTALFRADGGKAAYVVASLRPLSDDDARRFVLMAGKGEAPGTRFKRFYRAIEGAGANFERALRDPYDFAHLVRFLRLGPDGEPTLPGGAAIWRAALDGSGFPRTKEDLAAAVADAKKRPDDALSFFERLLERDVAGAVASVPAQKRFLLVSSLVERRPALRDPGVILLLFRGLESFLPLYDALADLPLDSPADVESVLFTFRRLDNSSERRPDELRAGLFQASMNLLADLARSGGLGADEVRGLTTKLVALPVFASDDPELPDVLPAFGDFVDDGLLEALRAFEARSLSTREAEEGRRRAEYRAALDARNARVLEAFRRRHPSRTEAEEKLHSLLSPVCPPDDALFGPFAPRYTLERQWLAATLAKQGEAPGRAEERAAVILNEAIAAERARTRVGGDEPLKIEGEVEGTFAYADPEEPLPRFASLGESAPQATADDLLRAALAGWRGSVTFTWRGGRYRYDPVADEIARRKRFVEHQRLGTLEGARTARRHRRALLEAAAQGKLPEARREATAVADALVLDGAPSPDPRVARLERAAQETLERMQTIRKPAGLSRVPEHLRAMDAVIGERTLEALLGHAYAASAGDANNVYYQDPDFVRRHSFHAPFRPTALRAGEAGQGFTIGGALSGLPDVLGLLHAEQLVYRPGASIPNEEIRMGLIAPVARLSVARLDDDALRLVAASC